MRLRYWFYKGQRYAKKREAQNFLRIYNEKSLWERFFIGNFAANMTALTNNTLRTTICLLLALCLTPAWAWNELDVENSKHYKKFRELYANGPDEEFYQAAADYEQFLKDNKRTEEYFKIKCNEGFYDLDHHHLLRATRTARLLDEEMRQADAEDFYYLSTGLLGDIYRASHNYKKAAACYLQALDEVGDRDQKFTMLKYMAMAEMAALTAPQEAIDWADKSLQLATETDNVEFQSLSLGIKGYILFLTDESERFFPVYDRYQSLLSKEDKRFNHRYDAIMAVARSAYDGDYERAEQTAKTQQLNVDRALALFRVYALAGNARKGFDAIAARFAEQDSILGESQESNINEMASEMELSKARRQAQQNKKLANRTMMILVGLTVAYLIIYIMGRRRLMLKIWDKNKSLKDALSRAEESERMKTAFIKNMSHEIRTPLNAISGFSQILCMPDYEASDEEKRKMRDSIANNVDSITQIVGELLDLAEGESDLAKAPVAVNELCRKAMEEAGAKNNKGLDMGYETQLADDYTVKSNAENLHRILAQLLDNAVKFTDQGTVRLRAEKRGKLLELSVEDTGRGVAEKDRKRIFENFVKLDEYKGGVGLGLPVCLRLAKALGGDLTLDDAYTAGSRFVLTVPTK